MVLTEKAHKHLFSATILLEVERRNEREDWWREKVDDNVGRRKGTVNSVEGGTWMEEGGAVFVE